MRGRDREKGEWGERQQPSCSPPQEGLTECPREKPLQRGLASQFFDHHPQLTSLLDPGKSTSGSLESKETRKQHQSSNAFTMNFHKHIFTHIPLTQTNRHTCVRRGGGSANRLTLHPKGGGQVLFLHARRIGECTPRHLGEISGKFRLTLHTPPQQKKIKTHPTIAGIS